MPAICHVLTAMSSMTSSDRYGVAMCQLPQRPSVATMRGMPPRKTSRKPTPGEIIRARREELGLTQKELAERTHIDASAISNIERNVVGVGPERGPRLADALSMSDDDRRQLNGAGAAPRPTVQTIVDLLAALQAEAEIGREALAQSLESLLSSLQQIEDERRLLAASLQGILEVLARIEARMPGAGERAPEVRQ